MGNGIFLGLTTVDIFNYVDKYPGSNEKNKARSQLINGGGPAANAAVAYAAFHNTTHLITGLGTQPLADLAAKDLENHGVNVVDLAEKPGQLPVLSSIIVDESSGDRSVVYSETTDRRLMAESNALSLPAGATVLMVDGYYLPQATYMAKRAKQSGIPVVLDGGSWKEGLEELLPSIDYAICSANFYPPGCHTRESVLSFLKRSGVANIGISTGGGSIYGWRNEESREIPVARVEVLDTLGAGDILHGAFCHFIQSRDFFTSLGDAAEVATFSCKYRGTRTWIHALDASWQPPNGNS